MKRTSTVHRMGDELYEQKKKEEKKKEKCPFMSKGTEIKADVCSYSDSIVPNQHCVCCLGCAEHMTLLGKNDHCKFSAALLVYILDYIVGRQSCAQYIWLRPFYIG